VTCACIAFLREALRHARGRTFLEVVDVLFKNVTGQRLLHIILSYPYFTVYDPNRRDIEVRENRHDARLCAETPNFRLWWFVDWGETGVTHVRERICFPKHTCIIRPKGDPWLLAALGADMRCDLVFRS
jgi:hypothetical protein